jgi:hypothetical protein
MKKLLIVLALLSFVLTGCSGDDENQVRSFDGVKISYDVQGKGEPIRRACIEAPPLRIKISLAPLLPMTTQ